MKKLSAAARLSKLKACTEAKDWVSDRETTDQQSWDECERGDWMLWLLAKTKANRKQLVRAACACARQSLEYVKKGENRPRVCIETTERWCDGDATIAEVREARSAANAAANAADANSAAYAAAYAANAAADAANAAANAADADDAAYAANAAYAAYAAANAADAYAAAAAADAYAAAAAAANAAANAAYAAYAAANAAYAAYAAARKQSLRNAAKIVRKFFPKVPKVKS